MNVTAAIFWLFILIFVKNIDYVEYTLIQKIINYTTQLLLSLIFVTTAIHLHKPTVLLRKLALFGNYGCVTVTVAVLYKTSMGYFQASNLISIDFLIVISFYCLFILPFLINIKALKASYPQPLTSE